MKKLFALFLLISISSCAHKDLVVNFDFDLYPASLKTGGKSVKVTVIDDRINKETIGEKIYGSNKVLIINNQNLEKLLYNKIINNLYSKGFSAGDDYIIKIYIDSLDYESSRGFFVGNSKAYGKIKVNILENKTGREFKKDYELANQSKHFLISKDKTDIETLNNLLQELINDFLSDREVSNYLQVSELNNNVNFTGTPEEQALDKQLQRWYMLF